MKKANANLRIELAQYKDMESFAQFSSDLDAETAISSSTARL